MLGMLPKRNVERSNDNRWSFQHRVEKRTHTTQGGSSEMKRAMTVLAVIAAMGLVFGGCKKKPEEKKDDTKTEATEKATDEGDEKKPEGDEKKPEGDEKKVEGDEKKPEADEKKPEGETIGIAECDEYLKVYKCYLDKLPAAGKEAAEKAFSQMVDGWKKGLDAAMDAAPAKEAIAKGCTQALEAFKKAMAENPMAKDCF